LALFLCRFANSLNSEQGDRDRAEELYQEALSIWNGLKADTSADTHQRRKVAANGRTLADLLKTGQTFSRCRTRLSRYRRAVGGAVPTRARKRRVSHESGTYAVEPGRLAS
jgi:hypothetical protein